MTVMTGKDLIQNECVGGWTSDEVFGSLELGDLAQFMVDARIAADALISIERSLSSEIITRLGKAKEDGHVE